MKTLKIFALLLLTVVIANAQSSTDVSGVTKSALPDTFQNVLDLAQMTFIMPKDAIPIPIVKNKQMHYEYAITFKDQPFEVRYSIAPVGYTVAEAYTGGKGITPHKEAKVEDEFGAKVTSTVVAMNVAGGRPTQGMGSNPFPPEAVKKEFGADWGSTTIIPLGNNFFGTEFKFCVMVTLFKKDVASAYVMYLSDTRENVIKLMGELVAKTGGFYALKFK